MPKVSLATSLWEMLVFMASCVTGLYSERPQKAHQRHEWLLCPLHLPSPVLRTSFRWREKILYRCKDHNSSPRRETDKTPFYHLFFPSLYTDWTFRDISLDWRGAKPSAGFDTGPWQSQVAAGPCFRQGLSRCCCCSSVFKSFLFLKAPLRCLVLHGNPCVHTLTLLGAQEGFLSRWKVSVIIRKPCWNSLFFPSFFFSSLFPLKIMPLWA